MYLALREVEYEGDPWFTIMGIGDVHRGTMHHDKAHFLKDVKSIEENPNALWIGIGDYCEAIVLSDPRFSASEIAKEFQPYLDTLAVSQRDSIVQDFKPIAGKCIGLLEGNHEYENKHRHYVDITRDMCRELDTQFLGDTAMIRLCFKKMDDGKRIHSTNLIIYAEHGHGGGRKKGGKINSLEDIGGSFDADLYLRGHVHDRNATPSPRLEIPSSGKPKLIERKRYFVLTGCYYRTYQEQSSSYGERKSYAPSAIGAVPIYFRPNTGELRAEV